MCALPELHLWRSLFWFEIAGLLIYIYRRYSQWERRKKIREIDPWPNIIVSREQIANPQMVPIGPQCKLNGTSQARTKHVDASCSSENSEERHQLSDRPKTTPFEPWSFPPLTPPYDLQKCLSDPSWKQACYEAYRLFNWHVRRSKRASVTHCFGYISKNGRKGSKYMKASALINEFRDRAGWDTDDNRKHFGQLIYEDSDQADDNQAA